jgi:hypothetical protein
MSDTPPRRRWGRGDAIDRRSAGDRAPSSAERRVAGPSPAIRGTRDASAAARARLLEATAVHLLECGHWPDIERLQWRADRREEGLDLAGAAARLPVPLGTVDSSGRLRLTPDGLASTPAGRDVLLDYVSAIRHAFSRYGQSPRSSITRRQLRRRVRLSPRRTRRIMRVMDADDVAFAQRSRWLDRVRHGVTVGPEIRHFAHVESVESLLNARRDLATPGRGGASAADSRGRRRTACKRRLAAVVAVLPPLVAAAIASFAGSLPANVVSDILRSDPEPPPTHSPSEPPTAEVSDRTAEASARADRDRRRARRRGPPAGSPSGAHRGSRTR